MTSRPPASPSSLPALLQRIEKALAEGHKRHLEWKETWARAQDGEHEGRAHKHSSDMENWENWAHRHAQGLEHWARHMGAWAERTESRKQRRKWARQMRRERERERKRAQRHQRHLAEADPITGWFLAVIALVVAGMAVFSDKWWLIFVALGMGSSAANILGRVRERNRLQQGAAPREGLVEGAREPAPPQPAEAPRAPEDPRNARVDTLCDKLLAELRTGSGVLRDVVHQPEQTVEGLRKSCHELARRERELRALSSPEDERRLEEERARLAGRVEAESDAVVKERLEKTLRLLDEQRRQRAELGTAASRLEAEHMRLYYTLENLYTQVLRVRSADAASADVAGAGLRQSVEQLGVEMDAVAEALEEVHRDAPPRERVPSR